MTIKMSISWWKIKYSVGVNSLSIWDEMWTCIKSFVNNRPQEISMKNVSYSHVSISAYQLQLNFNFNNHNEHIKANEINAGAPYIVIESPESNDVPRQMGRNSCWDCWGVTDSKFRTRNIYKILQMIEKKVSPLSTGY